MDNKTPIQTTGIPTAKLFTGRKGYKKASPKLAKASASDAKAGAFSEFIFLCSIDNKKRSFFIDFTPNSIAREDKNSNL
jgi:hypothetical protein